MRGGKRRRRPERRCERAAVAAQWSRMAGVLGQEQPAGAAVQTGQWGRGRGPGRTWAQAGGAVGRGQLEARTWRRWWAGGETSSALFGWAEQRQLLLLGGMGVPASSRQPQADKRRARGQRQGSRGAMRTPHARGARRRHCPGAVDACGAM